MKKVRLGIAGVGIMGSAHARSVMNGGITRCELAGVCDREPSALERLGGNAKRFTDYQAMIRSGEIDAILIATPHYDHTTIGIAALRQGLHVLVEKPISVHKADAERLLAAHTDPKQVFAAVFNQRTDPHYRKIRRLITDGELGELVRVSWIITTWFRSEAYYAGGAWRATWAGEGGGVLLNQCPHQLDLLQWLCGMPRRVTGFCSLGKRHAIEVEDEVTAYLDYANGATGVFVTSTGELPGTNRLEICGVRGKVVVEEDRIAFVRNEVPSDVYSRTTKESFKKPDVWDVRIPVEGHGGQHKEILQNFVDAILDGVPLIAPAREGIHSVELGNAMLFSSLLGKTVDLPMDAKAYERRLKALARGSRYRKPEVRPAAPADLKHSF